MLTRLDILTELSVHLQTKSLEMLTSLDMLMGLIATRKASDCNIFAFVNQRRGLISNLNSKSLR
jgi:hypothetical protein